MKRLLVLLVLAALPLACRSPRPVSVEDAFARAEGHRLRGDVEEALWLYGWAGKRDHYPSQLELGAFYHLGRFADAGDFADDGAAPGTWRDPGKAEAWYRRAATTLEAAAREGDAEATFQLAILYDGGLWGAGAGVLRDSQAARRLYRRAAALHHPVAHVRLGWYAYAARDAEGASRHFAAACDLGHADGCFLVHYSDYLAAYAAADALRVVEILRRGVAVGSSQARTELEAFLRDLRHAAARGHTAAQGHLDALAEAGLLDD